MSRWALGIVVVLLAFSAGLGWRANDLSHRLEETRSDLAAANVKFRTLQNASGDQVEDLERATSELKALTSQLRKARGELRDRQRCPIYPRLIITPSAGPPGTRVGFDGYCFVNSYANDDLNTGYGLFIMNPAQDLSDPLAVSNGGPDCELIAGTKPNELVIRRNGTATGYLTIPTSGACFQENRNEPVTPGDYHIGFACHTCSPLAIFRVTESRS